MSTAMNTRLALLEAIETLPEERISQIADYVEFIRQQEELRKRNSVDAMEAAERGKLKTFGTVEEMFASLHADN
jgi:hypothetical protein